MPDYAACVNEECTRKNTCCRYLMVSDKYYQSVLALKGTQENCNNYWPIEIGAPFALKSTQEVRDE